MLNVQLYNMQNSFGLSHLNYTPSSHSMISPFANKVAR